MTSDELTEDEIAGEVALRYNGDPKKPDKRGFITGVTRYPGLKPGEHVVITDAMLRYLKRPLLGDEGRVQFADYLAGIHNMNRPIEKWTVVMAIPNETEEPEQVQSEEKQETDEPVVESDDTAFIRRIFGGSNDAGDDEEKE